MLEPFCTLPLPKWHQILAFALLAAQIAAAMPVTSQSIRPEIPTTPTGDANGLSTLAERINGTCFRSLEPTQVLNNSTIKENGEEVEPRAGSASKHSSTIGSARPAFAAEPSVPKVEALNSSVPHGVYSYLEGSGYKIADSIANTRANHTLTYVGDALERPVPATTNAEEPVRGPFNLPPIPPILRWLQLGAVLLTSMLVWVAKLFHLARYVWSQCPPGTKDSFGEGGRGAQTNTAAGQRYESQQVVDTIPLQRTTSCSREWAAPPMFSRRC